MEKYKFLPYVIQYHGLNFKNKTKYLSALAHYVIIDHGFKCNSGWVRICVYYTVFDFFLLLEKGSGRTCKY